MHKRLAFAVAILLAGLPSLPRAYSPRPAKVTLRVGVAAIPITPFGANPEWDGPVTESGVWGERFRDTNHNGRWDAGEPFTDVSITRIIVDPTTAGSATGTTVYSSTARGISSSVSDDCATGSRWTAHGPSWRFSRTRPGVRSRLRQPVRPPDSARPRCR